MGELEGGNIQRKLSEKGYTQEEIIEILEIVNYEHGYCEE